MPQADCTDWNTGAFFKKAAVPDVVRCLEKGADIEARNRFENTPLDYAAHSGTAETVNALLKAGANIEARNTDGNTPLHYATGRWGAAERVNAMLKAGADIEARKQQQTSFERRPEKSVCQGEQTHAKPARHFKSQVRRPTGAQGHDTETG